MPVAVARKIEYRLHQKELNGLDIQVRPIVLTHEQCIRYRLPRTPIKETEKRAARFEERFGEGATELDALEALHPGELERILTLEIGRYYDADLDDRISDVAGEVEAELDTINTMVRKRHAKELAALESERKKLAAGIRAFEKKAKPVLRRIEKDLEAEAPDVDAYDWPEPDDGDEDDDPLFDSTRDFIEQTDRYKEHQGKPTESTRKPYDFFTAKCASCGKEFEATSRSQSLACSNVCREQLRRDKAQAAKVAIPCVICGTPFKSIRGAVTCSNKCRKKFTWQPARVAEQRRARRLRDAPPPIPCVICGTPFKSIRGAVTCSRRCRDKLVRRGK
jgi:predicted nucleic acid-binding Zn ribbon protein